MAAKGGPVYPPRDSGDPGAMFAILATLVEGRRFEAWDVHASEWHLLQAQPRIPTVGALTLTYRLRSPTARA